MKIAVTTPTGHVGRTVAQYLLDRHVQVRLLARRPEKLKDLSDSGAEVVRGAQDDRDYLIAQTRGIDALFWATPPGYGSDDVRAFQNRFGKVAAEAVRTNHVPRVVNLSSLGAQLSSGVGPINGLHDVEQALNEVCPNVIHLRPGAFYENFLWQLEPIKNDGCFYLPVSGDRRMPMIACRDIARVAADRLTHPSWTGRWVEELFAPVDLSYEECAQIITEGIGRKIRYVKAPRDRARSAMIGHGWSENAADLMLEMFDAFEAGKLRVPDPRPPHSIMRTTFAEFVREVMAPMLEEVAPR